LNPVHFLWGLKKVIQQNTKHHGIRAPQTDTLRLKMNYVVAGLMM
jgi:hypothetical protein